MLCNFPVDILLLFVQETNWSSIQMQHLSRFFFTHKLFNIYTLFYYWIYQYIFEVLELCSRWKIRLVIISTCSGILFLPTVYINEYSRGNGNSFNRKSRKKIIRRIGFYLTYMYYTILYLLYFTRLKIWHFQNVLNLLTLFKLTCILFFFQQIRLKNENKKK